MNEYGNFIRRADLIKNLIARQQLDEETAASKPNKAIVDANKQRWFKYQELLRDSLTARIAAANSSGGTPSGGGAYGTLTTAWIAATGETDLTILGALNTLETDLTTYGLTAKMKALYPMVGGTAAKHKFNFMDARDLDAAYRLVFSGGWTHSSTGALPNGTNAYADTKLNTSTVLSISSAHISHYARTTPNDGVLMGNENLDCILQLSGGQLYGSLAAYFSNTTQAANAAFYMVNRPNGTNQKLIRNSTILLNDSRTSTSFSNKNILLGAYNGGPAYPSNAEVAFSSIGNGFTDTEAANFYTAVQTFQTALSRNV